MKNKKLQSGFVLQSAFCDCCDFCVTGGIKIPAGREFHFLKEEIVSEMQNLHEQSKPAACSGRLTVIFSNAVKEK